MSQTTIKCAECGFSLTYTLIDTATLDISEFVLYGNVWLCKQCHHKYSNLKEKLNELVK